MTIKSLSIVAAAALALCAGAAQAVTQNGFANGGFEIVGDTTPAEGWLSFQAGYTRSTDAYTGEFSAQLAAPQLQAAIMEQNAIKDGGMPALIVGDTPMFSFWAKGNAGDRGNVNFQLRYLNDNGNILAESGPQFFQAALKTTEWTEFSYSLGAVPDGATAAFVLFAHATGDGTLGSVLIDDAYLGVTAVPEPGTYAMLLTGLGVVGLMARRRRAA